MIVVRYVQPPILVRISKSNFCQTWQNFPNHFCLFWHKRIMQILAFSKVVKFCYTFCHGQWQFIHADVCHIWQKCLLFLYFCISAYIAGFGYFIMTAKFGINSQPNFARFGIILLHNDVSHIWQKCPLFLYFYNISGYIVGFGFFIMLVKFGKNSQFPKMETKTHNEM